MDIGVIQRLANEKFENYPVEIRVYVEGLFERISTGTIVDPGVVENVSWQPQPNDCHNNVDFWCKYNSEYTPARGWLVYDFIREANIVLFQQHSVLIDPKGDLLDITPTSVDERYPFIFLSDPDEKYFSLESDLVNGNLFYVCR